MKTRIDIRELYRLPYSKNDNPNGWLEITTRCNAACPGCYRGCHLDENVGEHKTLVAIKEEIVRLQEIRNCHTISISGGEALMHPDLDAILAYIRDQGLRSLLYTNGRLLSEERVRELKTAGLDGIIIRIDTLIEDEGVTEADLNVQRDGYLDIIQKVGDILPAFTMVVDKRNIDQVADVLGWAEKRQIGFLVLIARRDFIFNEGDKPQVGQYIDQEELAGSLARQPGFRFSAFLGSQMEDETVKWIQAFRIIHRGRTLGYGDRKLVEIMQVWHHLTQGKYCYVEKVKNTKLDPLLLVFLALINHSMRRVLRHWLADVVFRPAGLFERPSLQVINSVFPPTFIDGRRDFCDGCPDAILYKGRLVPSCVLEEIKKFGAPYVMETSTAIPTKVQAP